MIRTYDRRLRVYVSSVLEELATERQAVRAAVEQHRLSPVMIDMAARPYPPPALSRAYISQSDVFVGVYWQEYGAVPVGEDVSTIEAELRLSEDMPRLLYVKQPAPHRDPRLTEVIGRVRQAGAVAYRSFQDADELRELVVEDLAVLFTERFETVAAEGDTLGADATTPARPLPQQPTSFIGRDEEVARLRAAILRDDVRLVTLLGAGGIGKSRLALEVARGLGDAFRDGIFFVPLARVTQPDLVMAAIAAEVGVRSGQHSARDSLVSALQGRQLLLILDNFEHVVGAAADLGEVLALVPGLTALVTSRRLLRLRGEQEHLVLPLGVPQGPAEDEAALQESDAARLFIERAEAVGLAVDSFTPAEIEAVAEIVRRLDGVPLAIELAAARSRVLRPVDLLDRLCHSIDVLGGTLVDLPERQRSLRATLDWSHALLAPHVARLLARLSTFVDGWTLEAAEAVCPEATDSVAMLDSLSELVDSSMVMVDVSDSERVRFKMLAPIREYARERLEQLGERRDIDARHLAYFRSLCDEAAVGLRGRQQPRWLDRLEAESGNLTVLAQRGVAANDLEDVALVAWAVWRWIWLNDHVTAARYWMEPIVTRAADLTPPTRAKAWWIMGCLLYEQGVYDDAHDLVSRAQRLFDAVDEEYGSALAMMILAGLRAGAGDTAGAYASWRESAAVLRRHGDHFSASVAEGSHGIHLLLNGGDSGEADRLIAAALDDARAIDNDAMVGLTRLYQGLAALLRRDLEGATRLLEAVVLTSGGRRSDEVLAYGLEGLAGVALSDGDAARAATLFGAATGVRARTGLSPWPHVRPLVDALVTAAREALGDAAFERPFSDGRRLTAAAARRYALRSEARADPAARATASTPTGQEPVGLSQDPGSAVATRVRARLLTTDAADAAEEVVAGLEPPDLEPGIG